MRILFLDFGAGDWATKWIYFGVGGGTPASKKCATNMMFRPLFSKRIIDAQTARCKEILTKKFFEFAPIF
jgi:hypothetical protein